MTTEKRKPIHTLRIGPVKAAIWENETKSGGIRYSTSISRIYRVGDKWRDTNSFGRDELPLLAKLLNDVDAWLTAKTSQPQAVPTQQPASSEQSAQVQ